MFYSEPLSESDFNFAINSLSTFSEFELMTLNLILIQCL